MKNGIQQTIENIVQLCAAILNIQLDVPAPGPLEKILSEMETHPSTSYGLSAKSLERVNNEEVKRTNEAVALLEDFHKKFSNLMDKPVQDFAPVSDAFLEEVQQNKTAYEDAAFKIIRAWKKAKNSGKNVSFNPQGNHSDAFNAFLNNHKNIPKILSHDKDQALLAEIQNGNWNSPLFRDPESHYSAMNLFANDKITWEQKATISYLIETKDAFGDFIAYPILDDAGNYTDAAQAHLFQFMHNGFGVHLKPEQRELLREVIKKLPMSEQFFFIFPEQKLDENGSSPSPHTTLREDTSQFMGQAGNKLLNYKFDPHPDYTKNGGGREFVNKNLATVTSLNHPAHFSYTGILKCSYSVENAIGLLAYGVEDWVAIIPRLSEQSINDVDYFLQRKARPTIAAESRYLGLFQGEEKIHGGIEEYPGIVAHDDYHRHKAAFLGNKVHNAIERIITLARETFGIQWSKDIWILRDFDLEASADINFLNNSEIQKEISKEEITKKFVKSLQTTYLYNQLENFKSEALKKILDRRFVMFDEKFHPKEMLLCFFVDLVRNPEIWYEKGIIAEQNLFEGIHGPIFQVARILNENHFFDENMKKNVIKFHHAIEKYFKVDIQHNAEENSDNCDISMSFNLEELIEECKMIDAELDQYEVKRDNTRAFLGFVKKQNTQEISMDVDKTIMVGRGKVKADLNENTDMDVERSTKSKRHKLG